MKNDKVQKPELIEELSRVNYRRVALFRCACGNSFTANIYSVESGRKKTCGCSLQFKINGLARQKHGMCATKEYSIWTGMKKRCYSESNMAYVRYGGNGIMVCNRWRNSFENFIEDMGRLPTQKHTLDRKDNALGYSPENCRWATMLEQQRNRGNTLFVRYNGERLRLTEFAEQNDMTYSTAYMRLYRNQIVGMERL